jgi:hypothetical protein
MSGYDPNVPHAGIRSWDYEPYSSDYEEMSESEVRLEDARRMNFLITQRQWAQENLHQLVETSRFISLYDGEKKRKDKTPHVDTAAVHAPDSEVKADVCDGEKSGDKNG